MDSLRSCWRIPHPLNSKGSEISGKGAPGPWPKRSGSTLSTTTNPSTTSVGCWKDAGVKVLRLPRATEAFFGLSVKEDDGGPAIVINTWERISVERWIFSAAHELGHLLLHPGAYDYRQEEEPMDEERQADEFASFFLMPQGSFEREWYDSSGHPLYERVLKVKRIFHVSYKTVLLRLVQMEEAPREVLRYLPGAAP